MVKDILETAANELWWMNTIQGAFAIFFGVAAIFWPGLTLVTLVYLFSIFVLVWGVIEIVHAGMNTHRQAWWLTLLFGALGVGVGVYLLLHPAVSFHTFVFLIGLTLIARGVLDISGAFVNKASTTSKVLWAIVGVTAVVAGIIILQQPIAGGVAFVWVLGIYALIFGALMIALGFELRSRLEKLSAMLP